MRCSLYRSNIPICLLPFGRLLLAMRRYRLIRDKPTISISSCRATMYLSQRPSCPHSLLDISTHNTVYTSETCFKCAPFWYQDARVPEQWTVRIAPLQPPAEPGPGNIGGSPVVKCKENECQLVSQRVREACVRHSAQSRHWRQWSILSRGACPVIPPSGLGPQL